MTTGTQYPASNPGKIVIYQTDKPKKYFSEIGRVSIDKFNNFGIPRSGDEVHKLLKEKAASIGGDAIIAISEDFGSISGVVVKIK